MTVDAPLVLFSCLVNFGVAATDVHRRFAQHGLKAMVVVTPGHDVGTSGAGE